MVLVVAVIVVGDCIIIVGVVGVVGVGGVVVGGIVMVGVGVVVGAVLGGGVNCLQCGFWDVCELQCLSEFESGVLACFESL
jgi:hypothetical protein